jgi:hypothetical protein
MSKFRTTLGIAALALASLAQPAKADLYLGFGVGTANLDDRIAGSTDELNGEDTSEQFFFGLGLGRSMALEFGRIEFGVLADTVTIGGIPTPAQYTADGRSISLLFREELANDFSLYLRAGVFNWDATTDLNNGATVTFVDGQNGVFGFGATYEVGDHLTFRAEYTQYELRDVDVLVPSFSVSYGF